LPTSSVVRLTNATELHSGCFAHISTCRNVRPPSVVRKTASWSVTPEQSGPYLTLPMMSAAVLRSYTRTWNDGHHGAGTCQRRHDRPLSVEKCTTPLAQASSSMSSS
jgi:hypothetical protein